VLSSYFNPHTFLHKTIRSINSVTVTTSTLLQCGSIKPVRANYYDIIIIIHVILELFKLSQWHVIKFLNIQFKHHRLTGCDRYQCFRGACHLTFLVGRVALLP
jgi:hypothetical protein